MDTQHKHYYINEDGFNCYTLDCGCEGTDIPGFGWKVVLCEDHEEEQEDLLAKPLKHKVKKFNDRDAI